VRALALIAALSSLALAAPATAVPPAHSAASATGSPADSVGFERASRIGFDLLILRPLNLVTTTLSLAGAVVAYPVALPFGGQGHVVDYLIKDPIDRTFRQPLGAL
jgi:hypothetical protein